MFKWNFPKFWCTCLYRRLFFFVFLLSFKMSWSHIRSFYPFTFIIKKTTAILKKYLFANILSYSHKLKKNWLKKVYIIFNNSKSNRDFNSIFFTMMRKTVCDDIFQGYKNPEKKSNLIYTTSRHIVQWLHRANTKHSYKARYIFISYIE